MFKPYDQAVVTRIEEELANMGMIGSFWSINDIHFITEENENLPDVDDKTAFEILQRVRNDNLFTGSGVDWEALRFETESYLDDMEVQDE